MPKRGPLLVLEASRELAEDGSPVLVLSYRERYTRAGATLELSPSSALALARLLDACSRRPAAEAELDAPATCHLSGRIVNQVAASSPAAPEAHGD